jgi:nucleoside-diphosphate-sugar epimerase
MKCLIVGCGYVGLPLGKELVRLGHEVFGLRRTATAADELNAVGVQPLVADVTRLETLANLPYEFDWVVNCLASRGGSAEDYRRIYLEGTRHLLKWLAPSPPRKFVYTSSTSVYGQTDGSWVKETSATEPMADTAKILLETEKMLLASSVPLNRSSPAWTTFSPTGGEGQVEGASAAREALPHHQDMTAFSAVILRVAGIYGPDRGHWFKQFLKNEAHTEGDGSRFLNMIHRADVIGGIIEALKNGHPGEIYNAVDDEPVSQLDFFQWLAEELGRDLPLSMPENHEENRKRGMTNKRVSNRKLKAELGYSFKYPNFRIGYTEEISRLEQSGKLQE